MKGCMSSELPPATARGRGVSGGLMLLGHRYYDASIGRFISRDPAYAGDFPLPLFPRFARRGSEPGTVIVRISR